MCLTEKVECIVGVFVEIGENEKRLHERQEGGKSIQPISPAKPIEEIGFTREKQHWWQFLLSPHLLVLEILKRVEHCNKYMVQNEEIANVIPLTHKNSSMQSRIDRQRN